MPISTSCFQIMEHHGLHSLQDKFVGSLNLPIRLWVRCGLWLMLNAKIRIISGKLCSFELCFIICQNFSGHAESIRTLVEQTIMNSLSFRSVV
jgi:hypothetical protein